MPSSADYWGQGRRVGESAYTNWQQGARKSLKDLGVNEDEIKSRFADNPLGMADALTDAWMAATNASGNISSKMRDYMSQKAREAGIISMLQGAMDPKAAAQTPNDWFQGMQSMWTGGQYTPGKAGTAATQKLVAGPKTSTRNTGEIVGYRDDPARAATYATINSGESLEAFAERMGFTGAAGVRELEALNPGIRDALKRRDPMMDSAGGNDFRVKIVQPKVPIYGQQTTTTPAQYQTVAGTPGTAGKWTGGAARAITDVGAPSSWTKVLQDAVNQSAGGKNAMLNLLSDKEGQAILAMLLQRTTSPFAYGLRSKALQEYLAGQVALPNSRWFSGINPSTGYMK